ncbi:MAG TPA: NADPH-dependent FMN reductase [Chloroflexota bacterium]|nr:NADPH-dependent FMN reductase [Chloroflexota bacterium]
MEQGEPRDQLESTPLFIPVILGSIRRNRRSYLPARLMAERVEAAGHRTALIDLREPALPMYDEEESTEQHPAVLAFKAALAEADASVWFSPEYNHSFTGTIKNAIDFLHVELRRKPIAACGLATGTAGGVRATEALKTVLIELHAVPIRESIHFGDARTLFDAEGTFLRPDYIKRIDYMVADLVWYARALRWGRRHLPIPQRST